MTLPNLETDRLTLRGFEPSDAADVQRLAGAVEVAATTLTIPHPYADGVAEAWIATHAEDWAARARMVLAVTEPSEGLVGAIGLDLNMAHRRGELGYWIGVPFWNRGYVTEAARAVMDYGFDEIGLNRIEAQYLTGNPASARVMEKLGMRYEGTRRGHIFKWGEPRDVGMYAILAGDQPGQRTPTEE